MVFTALLMYWAGSFTWAADEAPSFSRVTYECDNLDIHRDVIQNFVEETVRDGLSAISSVNPSLYSRAIRVLAKRKLSVSCEVGIIPGVYAEEVNVGRKGSIHLGQMLWMLDFLKTGSKPSNQDALVATSRNIVFHEFLHFFQFDNIAPQEHNLGSSNGDLVYACAFVAFRNYLEHDMNLTESLNTCAAGIPLKN